MLQVKLEKPTRFNCSIIALGHGHFAIADKIPSADLWTYKWRSVRWNHRYYAFATRRLDGTPCRVSMHRLVAKTPHGETCHHLTPNSLDNRRCNLLNCIDELHRDFHHIRKWTHKRAQKKR